MSFIARPTAILMPSHMLQTLPQSAEPWMFSYSLSRLLLVQHLAERCAIFRADLRADGVFSQGRCLCASNLLLCLYRPFRSRVGYRWTSSFSLGKWSYRCILDDIGDGVPPCCVTLLLKIVKLKGRHKHFSSVVVCSCSDFHAFHHVIISFPHYCLPVCRNVTYSPSQGRHTSTDLFLDHTANPSWCTLSFVTVILTATSRTVRYCVVTLGYDT